MRSVPKGRARLTAGAVAAATAFALLTAAPPASADPASPAPATVPTPMATTVTLITGDTVTVSTLDGRTSVSAAPGPGGAATFQTRTAPDGDVYVYPVTALPAVASGLLDDELFNVTVLAASGYDDASRPTLPVIVEYAEGVPALSAGPALPATVSATPLPALHASGFGVDKNAAADFFAALGGGTDREARSANRIEKVWLDARVQIALEDSVPQIGAPGQWAAGHDGTGVKVAVLDTGADLAHPDLAGRVADSRSFVPGEEVADGHGHGTHVAATIAGSGAGSQGRRKGVAPGASLMVGKVLDNGGSGQSSWILDGMAWAARSGASVVSMSLGGDTDTPHDILSDAVDELTARYGSLFVIAAGNSGPASPTIGSPGTADSALTVGAVSKKDELAYFSGRGPRVGDNGLKPEITAPGVGIIAARSSGTTMGTPVDGLYTTASGTSMATPHVAGAAVIMKQIHPGFGPAQLKDALVSTAKNLPQYTAYQQGAGRVDLVNGGSASVFASAKADFGTVSPVEGGAPVQTREVTYTNLGATDVTLSLAMDLGRGTAPAEGEASLSASTLTVPAKGSAAVTVTVDPMLGAFGEHSGFLTASATGVALTTAVGYVRKPPEVPVAVKGVDRAGGMPYSLTVQLLNVDTGEWVYRVGDAGAATGSDTYTTTVPKGRYSVQAVVSSYDVATSSFLGTDYYARPEVVVDGPLSLTVDARVSVPLTVDVTGTERDLRRSWVATSITRVGASGFRAAVGSMGLTGDNDAPEGVIPAPGEAEHGTVQFGHEVGLADPVLTAKVAGGERLDVLVPVQGPRRDGRLSLTAVDAGAGSEADFARVDVKGRLAVVSVDSEYQGVQARRAKEAGAAAVLFVRATAGGTTVRSSVDIPAMAVPFEQGRRLLKRMGERRTVVDISMRPESRYTYLVPAGREGTSVPAKPSYKVAARDFAEVRTSYAADGARRLDTETMFSWHDWQATSYRTFPYVQAPSVRSEYVYAPGMRYRHEVRAGEPWMSMTGALNTYRARQRYDESWLGGPLHPGVVAAPCALCRTESAWSFGITPYADSDPGHTGTYGVSSVAAKLFRDGAEVTTKDFLVPGTADYRVEYTTGRATSPGASFGTTISTSWGFRSAAPTSTGDECAIFGAGQKCGVLPVILTGYDLPLNLLNQARAGREMEFGLRTFRAPGHTGPSGVSGAKVSVSYDDGATWRAADVDLGRDGVHEVEYEHPRLSATNGYVSLRVEVWDGAGNRTAQTIIRAYALV